MKISRIFSLLVVGLFVASAISCGQDYNSHSGDASLGGSDCDANLDANFCAAQAVLSSKCLSCHMEWADYKTDADWLGAPNTSPLVTAQDINNSSLIYRIQNYGGLNGKNSNMPQGGGPLSDEEYNALVTWVLGMGL